MNGAIQFNRKQIFGVIAVFGGLAWLGHWAALHPGFPKRIAAAIGERDSTIQVAFTPGNGDQTAEHLVLSKIGKAHDQILVASSVLNNVDIVAALVDAHQKTKVPIMVVVDKTQGNPKFSAARLLHDAGISVRVGQHPMALNDDFLVVDGNTVATGSFRYGDVAVHEDGNNVIAIEDDEAAKQYQAEWMRLWNAGDDFEGDHHG